MADMNLTPARAGLIPQIWDSKFFAEYVRANRFRRYMGETETSMIQIKDDLTVKNGDSITFASVRSLKGAGVTGNTILEGNEEVLDQRSMKLTVAPVRHAVAVSEWDEQRSSIDIRDAAKTALKTWMMEKMRSDVIIALSSIPIDGTGSSLAYSAASAGQRNAWLVANSDRIQVGKAVSNSSSGVMATALATVDNTDDKMTGALLSLAKRRAQTATPHIRPIRQNDETDEEWFVCFMPSLAFRDFRNDPPVQQALRDARSREGDSWKENPLFAGGDIVWDGIVVREIPELPVLTGAGTAGIDVAASFLCGAQAIGVGWAKRTKSTTNVRDYDFMHGVGIMEMRAVGKLSFGKDASVDTTTKVDQGVATIFTAAVADA